MKIELISSAEDYYLSLIDSISGAQKRITMLYYAYCNGKWSEQINKALINTSSRGVPVELFVCLSGALSETAYFWENFIMYERLRKSGIKVKLVPDLVWGGTVHAKICVIDTDSFFLGGSNLADHYLDWTDTNFKISGSTQIEEIHNQLTRYRYLNRKLPEVLPLGNNINFSVQDTNIGIFEKEITKIINGSQKYLKIVTWYFAPTLKIMNTILKARRRGVEVEIIYSVKTRFPLFNPIRSYYANLAIKEGINIYQWKNGFNHSKLYWNESNFLIGSPNLDFYSLEHSHESIVWGKQKSLIAALNKRFNEFQNNCSKIN